uniref:ANK_REP_REGION domain-containing protein n=1 Tax=Heterorhabditis bacteriophora TaxID=37862 RepID=A0A1I7XLP9_HETBA
MRTPLHYAAEQGQLEMVRLLIANGARNTTRDKRGAYPAHYAAQYSVNCLDLILAENKYVDVKDQDNRSCLMWAVCAGNVEVIQYLVYKTAPDRQDRDNRGYTALHLAAMVGNENICKLLVKQGWNLTTQNQERDKFDNTPLHLAAGRGHTDVVRFLVTAGANMNEKDAMSRTPVYWACFGGQAHTLYCMIKELGFEWRTVVK